jgi:hypothetical protein
MSKMGSHCSFEHLKHKLWPKERPGVKVAVWLLTTKFGNQPLFDIRFESATWSWKALDESYNFALDRVAIGLCSQEIWASKVLGLQPGTISGLQLESLGKNNHLDVVSAASCRVYYKGEGGGFPQVWAVVSLVCPCCLWLVLVPRVLQLCTNHFVWVVCRPVWMSEACQLLLVPSRSSNTPLYPSKCCELGSVPQLLLLSLSYLGSHLGPWRVGGASS